MCKSIGVKFALRFHVKDERVSAFLAICVTTPFNANELPYFFAKEKRKICKNLIVLMIAVPTMCLYTLTIALKSGGQI